MHISVNHCHLFILYSKISANLKAKQWIFHLCFILLISLFLNFLFCELFILFYYFSKVILMSLISSLTNILTTIFAENIFCQPFAFYFWAFLFTYEGCSCVCELYWVIIDMCFCFLSTIFTFMWLLLFKKDFHF